MVLNAVPGVVNRGVILNGPTALPATTEMLVLNASGNITTQSIPVASFGALTGLPSDNAALASALEAKLNSSAFTFANLDSKPTTLSGYGITDAQPLDSDLTAIAALTTQSYGRSLLTQLDAAAARTTLGLGTLATQDGTFNGRLIASSGYESPVIGTTGHVLKFPDITGFLNLSMGTRGTGFSDRCQLHFQVAHNMLGQGFAATSEGFYVGGTAIIGFSSSNPKTNAPDLMAVRDAANTWAQRNGLNSQTWRLYNTFTDTGNYIRQALSFTTYSTVVHAQLAAEGLGTGAVNIPFVITPRGNGGISRQIPDGTTSGGNLRGDFSFDFGYARTSASGVASGTGAFLGTCRGPVGVGTYSVLVGGNENNATGSSVFVGGGEYSVATGTFAVVAGGFLNTASGDSSAVLGGRQSLANRYGQQAHAAGQFSAQGDAQYSLFVMRNKTTNATPVTLFLDGSSERLTLVASEILGFIVNIVGSKSDGSAISHYVRKGIIKRVGTTTTLAYVETVGTDYEDNPLTDVSITADDTNDALQIKVTGIAGETWRWVATVEAVDLGFGT